MIGDGYLGSKPSRNHLSPTGIRLIGLVYHGGVATEKEGHGRRVRLYSHLFHGRGCPGKLQGEILVPRKGFLLAGLDLHAHLSVDVRATLVDDEGEGLELALLGSDLIEHQPTALSAHHGLASLFLRAEHDGHLVVAVWHFDGIEERLVALALWRSYDGCCEGVCSLVLHDDFLHARL